MYALEQKILQPNSTVRNICPTELQSSGWTGAGRGRDQGTERLPSQGHPSFPQSSLATCSWSLSQVHLQSPQNHHQPQEQCYPGMDLSLCGYDIGPQPPDICLTICRQPASLIHRRQGVGGIWLSSLNTLKVWSPEPHSLGPLEGPGSHPRPLSSWPLSST